MKIGIDIRVLSGIRTGIGRLTKELLIGLAKVDKENQYILFYNTMKGQLPSDIPQQPNFRTVTVRIPNRALNAFWAITSFPKAETFTGPLDLFHGPSFQMPPTRRAANVLTIHDLVFLVHPEMAIPASVRHFGPSIGKYASRADIITTISNATAKDIIERLKVPAEKVVTVYPGATPLKCSSMDEIAASKVKYGIEGDYILFVGCIEPRKNLSRLLRAYEISGISKDFELVLAGPKGWHTDEIFTTWGALNCRERVRWIDYVGDDYLGPLYAGAAFLAYPSIMEGFGLPILEAMSVDCPVLTSNISAMPEIAGDAALTVNPLDIEDIADGLRRLAGDNKLREQLIGRGRERIKCFSWEKMARETLDVYRTAIDIRQGRKQLAHWGLN